MGLWSRQRQLFHVCGGSQRVRNKPLPLLIRQISEPINDILGLEGHGTMASFMADLSFGL